MNEDQDSNSANQIKVGDYIIIQRQGYFKLHYFSSKSKITLGKDTVCLQEIAGKPYWTIFKMVPTKVNNRDFYLEVATQLKSIPNSIMKEITSGMDNRNISDDGKSQLLRTEDIVGFRESGLSAQNIVDKLIENSTTFKDKTEYSQEKYLKKKEKKYYEYIIVRKPSLRLIADIFYSRDQFKVLGLRYDTIAQMLSLGNIQSNGTYILFESGTQALVGASILNCLGMGGKLINLSIGNIPQKQAILGLNLTKEQLERFMSVKITDFLQSLCSNDQNSVEIFKNENVNIEENMGQLADGKADKTTEENIDSLEDNVQNGLETDETKKRKISQDLTSEPVAKKPRWMEVFQSSINLLKGEKADGLIIACKEFPLNIIVKLLPFIKASRQIVVYSVYREPLVELYVELKKRRDIIALHVFENWLRSYQILNDRTHPDVTMSSNGGHLLLATTVMS